MWHKLLNAIDHFTTSNLTLFFPILLSTSFTLSSLLLVELSWHFPLHFIISHDFIFNLYLSFLSKPFSSLTFFFSSCKLIFLSSSDCFFFLLMFFTFSTSLHLYLSRLSSFFLSFILSFPPSFPLLLRFHFIFFFRLHTIVISSLHPVPLHSTLLLRLHLFLLLLSLSLPLLLLDLSLPPIIHHPYISFHLGF